MLNLIPWILALPLAGFIVLGLFGRRLPRMVISVIGCGVVLLAFLAAVTDFASLVTSPVAARSSDTILWTWLTAGKLAINVGVLSDPLSVIMLLIVTGVGFLIHVYSVGYMADDEGYWRFFAFLNLFVFAMALLVSADNFLFLLVGWAGVGLASYLLIGFWYTRPAAVAAARKAFVVNVIGDFGLTIAIFILIQHFGTVAYGSILSHSYVSNACVGAGSCPHLPGVYIDPHLVTVLALLLFVAAAAKSAQLPLHVWLPDAMEGPTPVSALIHAATMVTAGVYLVARTAVIFRAAPDALMVVGVIGGVTALFAATIACVQTDIKRVLAYSTMSQLGYMFLGEAAGNFSASIFHLTTHAYFKALLFMCAGAVIHALSGEQDMRKMGGLKSRMPITFWTFVVGGLALTAIFPFAGFWSKDAILGSVLLRATGSGSYGWYVLYAIGLLTALLTGFYTFRLIFSVFLGTSRSAPAVQGVRRGTQRSRADNHSPVHEPGLSMTVPMVVLAVLSLIGGLYGTPLNNAIGNVLSPVFGSGNELAPSQPLYWFTVLASLVAALAGIAIAWAKYGRTAPTFARRGNALIGLLEHRYYIDELYQQTLVRPVLAIARMFRRGVEGAVLDGATRTTGSVVMGTSRGLRVLQTGYVRSYAFTMLLGVIVILMFVLLHP